MKKLIFLVCIFTAYIGFAQTNVGIGNNNPVSKLDISGAISVREGAALSGLTTGNNNNVALPDVPSTTDVTGFCRITAPTSGAFTITGIVPNTNANGQIVTLINTTGKVMTIANASASSTAANRIYTQTGANLVDDASATANSSITLQYSQNGGGSGVPGWMVTAIQNYSISNTQLGNSSITVTPGTGVGVSGSPVSLGGTVTLTNTGVTSISSANPLTTNSSATGGVTVNLTGTVPVANGGTALGTTPSNGQILIGNGTGYTLGTIGSGSNITVTNTAGAISIAATGSGISGSGTTNYSARWTASNALGIGTTYDNGTDVGIGTTSPLNKLQVEGNLHMDGHSIYLRAGGGGDTYDFVQWGGITGGSGNDRVDIAGYNGVDLGYSNSGTGITTVLSVTQSNQVNIPSLATSSAVYTDASSNLTTTIPSSGALGYWTLSGTSLYPSSTSDNIGIGNSSPGSNLLNVSSSASNGYGINLAAETGVAYGSGGGSVAISGGAANMTVNSGNSGGSVTIAGGEAYVAGGCGSGGNINLYAGGNYFGTATNCAGAIALGNINFYTYAGSGTSATQAMIINGTTGNVGIGTTSPSANLHVIGSGIFTGTLYVNATGTGITTGAAGTVQIGDGSISKSFGTGFTMSSTLSVNTGYQIGGAASSGSYLRGNGSEFVSSTIQASDLSAGISGSTGYHAKFTGSNTIGNSGVVYETGSYIGINYTSPVGAIGFNNSGTNNIVWGAGPYTAIYDNGNIHYWTDDQTNFESGSTGTGAKWYWTAGQNATGNASGTSTWMTLTNGELGIGTTSPGNLLDVEGGNIDASGYISAGGTAGGAVMFGGTTAVNGSGSGGISFSARPRIGDWGQFLTIGEPNGTYNGTILQISNTGLYTGTSTSLTAAPTLHNVLDYNGTGEMGIGTTTPTFKLHVVGTGLFTSELYVNNNGTGTGSGSTGCLQLGDGVISKTYGTGFLFNSTITASTTTACSDERIKSIIGTSDNKRDLETLAGLKVTDYRYIDNVHYSDKETKKLIAQQVQEVYPQAVYTLNMPKEVPDIYQTSSNFTVDGDRLSITLDKFITANKDIKVGSKCVFYGFKNKGDKKGPQLKGTIEYIDSNKLVLCSQNTFNNDGYDRLFVYGTEVNDFLTVDYDAISMLNVSATQELARKVAALEKENEMLKNTCSKLNEQNCDLTEKLDAVSSNTGDIQLMKKQLDDLKILMEKNGIRTER